jgi:hypothetical protein
MINQSLRPTNQAECPKALRLDLNRNIEVLPHYQRLFQSKDLDETDLPVQSNKTRMEQHLLGI